VNENGTARTSFVATAAGATKRSVKKVPFVELFGGRLQGVVSSGSDIERVYVSFIEAKTGNFYCSTNNNRPCGGLGGRPCKHIASLFDEAVVQFGAETVAAFMKVEAGGGSLSLRDVKTGSLTKEEAGRVFSRFLSYLRYCELPAVEGHLSEMGWFG